MECVGVEVRSFRGKSREPRTLNTVDLCLPLAELADKARQKYKLFVFADTGDPEWDKVPWASGQSEQWGRPVIYRREHFEEVARVYREAYDSGKTPTRAVARHFRRSESAAAKWVARCRELGLLPKTTRGKARAVGRARLRWSAKGTGVKQKKGNDERAHH